MTDLKPCPFCKSKYCLTTLYTGHRERPWSVNCMMCGAEGPWSRTEKGCIKKWNRRGKRK